MLRYFKNFHVLKRYTLPYIYSSITLGEEEIKIILEDSERNYRHQMHLVVPCDSLVTFSSGSEAVLLFRRTEHHSINVSPLHAEVLVAWRAGGHILRSGLTI